MKKMNTFMTKLTFKKLRDVRDKLKRNKDLSGNLAGIFVPWAGSKMSKKPSIYYVGQGTDAGWSDDTRNFRCCYRETEKFVQCENNPRWNSPFWRFLNGLTTGLFDKPFCEIPERWGWSNLLKIGCEDPKEPKNWPPQLVRAQEKVCVESLRHEFRKLKRTLIFIGSSDLFIKEILCEALPGKKEDRKWKVHCKKKNNACGIYWWKDDKAGNLYVHGYHPNAAQRGGFFNKMLTCTAKLAREDVFDKK